jgi:hypothetical protein
MLIDATTCFLFFVAVGGLFILLCIAQGYYLYELYTQNLDLKHEINLLRQQVDTLTDRLQEGNLGKYLLRIVEEERKDR